MKYWSNSLVLGEKVTEASMSLSVKNRMKKVGYKFRLLCTVLEGSLLYSATYTYRIMYVQTVIIIWFRINYTQNNTN